MSSQTAVHAPSFIPAYPPFSYAPLVSHPSVAAASRRRHWARAKHTRRSPILRFLDLLVMRILTANAVLPLHSLLISHDGSGLTASASYISLLVRIHVSSFSLSLSVVKLYRIIPFWYIAISEWVYGEVTACRCLKPTLSQFRVRRLRRCCRGSANSTFSAVSDTNYGGEGFGG